MVLYEDVPYAWFTARHPTYRGIPARGEHRLCPGRVDPVPYTRLRSLPVLRGRHYRGRHSHGWGCRDWDYWLGGLAFSRTRAAIVVPYPHRDPSTCRQLGGAEPTGGLRCPWIAYSAVVPAPGPEGRPGPRRVGTVAQTVIAQVLLPTCSSYDHDTFPGYGVCARKNHDRGPVTRDCLALTTVHNDILTRMLYFS